MLAAGNELPLTPVCLTLCVAQHGRALL